MFQRNNGFSWLLRKMSSIGCIDFTDPANKFDGATGWKETSVIAAVSETEQTATQKHNLWTLRKKKNKMLRLRVDN